MLRSVLAVSYEGTLSVNSSEVKKEPFQAPARFLILAE